MGRPAQDEGMLPLQHLSLRWTAMAMTLGSLFGRAASQGYVRAPDHLRAEQVVGSRMHDVLALDSLPREIDWRWKDSQNYTSIARNQHIPLYCGACWSFATTAMLADRIRIARGAGSREVNLAMQVLLNCDKINAGCHGGDPLAALYYIAKNGIPEESCQPYQANGHDVGRHCAAEDICRTCNDAGCHPVSSFPVYTIQEYGMVRGEHEMKAELQRGPLACLVATPLEFDNLVGYNIFRDMTGNRDINHVISVLGYGEDNGKPYWVVRNSWGTYWGYYGFARVFRGENNIAIETECYWALPSHDGRPEWIEMEAPSASDEVVEVALAAPDCRSGANDWVAVGGEKVMNPQPHELFPEGVGLPGAWDWRNVSGRNFVTWNTNERNPQFCASCWAQGVASALSDRISVMRGGAWPTISLSPQVLINCVGGSSCESGGSPAAAYAYIHKHGLTDQTCQNYQAKDMDCDALHVCENCAPGNEELDLIWPGTCVPVAHPILYFVSEYGSVRGAREMKAEIYQRGPIGCGMEATASFRKYEAGIFEEELTHEAQLNHQVSLTGWAPGRSSTEAWIGRNSWGTAWGMDGWFMIRMHEKNLGVELDCDWGVPVPAAPVPSTMADGPPLVIYS